MNVFKKINSIRLLFFLGFLLLILSSNYVYAKHSHFHLPVNNIIYVRIYVDGIATYAPVNFRITGPGLDQTTTIPVGQVQLTFPATQPGTYTVQYNSGVPPEKVFDRIQSQVMTYGTIPIASDSAGTVYSDVYSNSASFTLDAHSSVHAGVERGLSSGFGILFSSTILTITKSGTGSGTVTSDPVGINCGADCSENYNSGTSVDLTANFAAGSTFAGWSGNADCTDGNVTMNAAKTCNAVFNLVSPPEADIQADPLSGGVSTVRWCGGNSHVCSLASSCKVGTTLGASNISTATSGVYSTPTLNSSNNRYYLECTNAGGTSYDNVTINTTFNITKVGTGTGYVEGAIAGDPTSISCEPTCSKTYPPGTLITLTATPSAGSVLAGFGGFGVDAADCADMTVTMSENTETCQATFNLSDFSLSSSNSSLKAPQTGASDSSNPTILVSPVVGFDSNVTVSMQACLSSLSSSCNDINSFPLGTGVSFLADSTITSAEYNNFTSFRFNTSATAPGTYYFRIKGVGGSPALTRYSSVISLQVVDLTVSSFTAVPDSGITPLNGVDLTAGVGGSAVGTINYKFDCTDDGTWDQEFNNISDNPKTAVDACNYLTAGTYTARVKIERDVANPVEQTTSVQAISSYTLTVQKIGSGKIEGNGINWDPDGVDGTVDNTPADQTEAYANNTLVSLTATAGTGSMFDHWQSDVALPCTGGSFNPVCSFNITQDIDLLEAVFNTPTLRVTPNETILRINQPFQFEAWYDPDGDSVGEYKVTRCAGLGVNPDYPGDAAKNCVDSITWNTSDLAKVSIDLVNKGSILGIDRGSATISAIYNTVDSNSNAVVRVIRYKWEER